MRTLLNRLGNISARYAGTVFLMMFFCAMSYKVALIKGQEQVTKLTEEHKAELLQEKISIYNLMAMRTNTKLDLIIQACAEANAVQINNVMLYCTPIDQSAPQRAPGPKHKQDEFIL